MIRAGDNFVTSDHLKGSYVAVLLAAAALYVVTCAPGALWQDSGVYQYRIWHNDIQGRLGLALSHPLYHIVGIGVKYIPLGEFAYRVNLISSVAAAFTIANLFLLLRLWLRRVFPAVVGAVTLAVSHTLWRHAVIAEDYTLYTALLTAELLMLLQYVKTRRTVFLYLLGLFNGLAIADHMWAVIPLACYMVFLVSLLARKQIGLKSLGVIVLLWVAGAAPYEYLIVKNLIQTGDLPGTVASAFFGSRWHGDVLNTRVSMRLVKENIMLMVYNFPTPNIVLFFVGLFGLRGVSPSRSFKNILLGLLILFFLFAFRYTVPDRYAFFIPFYCLVSVLVGVGSNLFLAWSGRRVMGWLVLALALLPVPTYLAAPVVAEKMRFELPTKREVPYRNNYTWFLRPWKRGYRGAERFANEVLDAAEGGAIIVADTTTVSPLLYVQEVQGKRKDVKIISEIESSEGSPEFDEQSVEELLAERAVYVVSPDKGYCPDFLLERYSFIPAGIVSRVVKKRTEHTL